MIKKILPLLMFVLIVSGLTAQDIRSESLKLADKEDWIGAYSNLKQNINQIKDKEQLGLAYAELAWFTIECANDLERNKQADKKTLITWFGEAQQFGAKAAEYGNPKGYFFVGACIGRWSQTKGVLDSLKQAESMRTNLVKALNVLPNHDNTLNVMGALYFGLSKQGNGIANLEFGNVNKAVSFDRKAIEFADITPDTGFLLDMAEHLSARNKSAEKRLDQNLQDKLDFDKTTGWQKNEFYEGACDFNKAYYWTNSKALNSLSDKEEAVLICTYVKNYYNQKKSSGKALTRDEQRKFTTATNLYAKLAK